MNILYLIKLCRKVNFWKTIYVNFHYLPFRKAIILPIFIGWRTKLENVGGKIVFPNGLWRGMIQIGVSRVGTQDPYYSRTIWNISGTLIIQGGASIGRGTIMCIAETGTLYFGKNLIITGNAQIICYNEIVFGDNNLFSWDILFMDTDFHSIYTLNNNLINTPKPIKIGNNVWIGCRVTILKGVTIADNNVVAANSLITNTIDNKNCIIGGHGKTSGIIKKDIYWNV